MIALLAFVACVWLTTWWQPATSAVKAAHGPDAASAASVVATPVATEPVADDRWPTGGPSPEQLIYAQPQLVRNALAQLPPEASAEDIQNVVYEIGRREPFLDQVKKGKDGRPGVSLDWFNMLYQVLLGQEKGPRFGSFVAVYGVANAIAMIDAALKRTGS